VSVICVAHGGSVNAARQAVRLIQQRALSLNREAYTVDCKSPPPDHSFERDADRPAGGLARSRAIINGVRAHQNRQNIVLIDASAASDHALATAVSLSDVVLLPLHIEENDDGRFSRDVGLIEIAGHNIRKRCRQIAFLTTNAASLSAAVHIGISGMLIKMGLETLATPLGNQSAVALHPPFLQQTLSTSPFDEFADCVLGTLGQPRTRSIIGYRDKVA
jgi:hypothetical protein